MTHDRPINAARWFAFFLAVWSLSAFLAWVGRADAAGPKNVILLIGDGAGFNSFRAAAMYEGKWNAAAGKADYVYNRPGWIAAAAATYPLTTSARATGTALQDRRPVYQPAKAWDVAAVTVKAGRSFAGYEWLMGSATDSAAAATALGSGVKTYNSAINWSNYDGPLVARSLPELAKARGMSCGVITTVPWSHATPAGLGGAHNRERNNYEQIAREMLDSNILDVIIGAGNPDFDDNGRPVAKHTAANLAKAHQYVGGRDVWRQLKAAEYPGGWTLIQSKADFEAVAGGRRSPPKRLLGTAQVYSTFQQARAKFHATDTPFYHPLNANVPDLATITRAALAAMESNPRGLYLMIEGGAIDWAEHSNQAARMIEEHVDFHRAIEAVVDWVERKSNFSDTLVVITADHETGMIWGPTADNTAYAPLVDHGRGAMPGLRFLSKSHTNSLVPLFARGPGSQRFITAARRDPRAAATWNFSGGYVDNTEIYAAAREVIVDR